MANPGLPNPSYSSKKRGLETKPRDIRRSLVTIESQIEAINKQVGIPLQELIAEALFILRKDFLEGKSKKEYIQCLQFVANKCLEKLPEQQTVILEKAKDMSDKELDEKLNKVLHDMKPRKNNAGVKTITGNRPDTQQTIIINDNDD